MKSGNRWMAKWIEQGKQKGKAFNPTHYMKKNHKMDFESAADIALQDAIKFRKELIERGVVKEKDSGSGYEGVTWSKRDGAWRARFFYSDKNGKLKEMTRLVNPSKFRDSFEDSKAACIRWRQDVSSELVLRLIS